MISINIVLADRTYRIRVAPENEGTVRATLKLINDKIISFKTQFAGKDMQDYISMVLLWYATEMQRPQGHNPVDEAAILQELDELNHMMQKAL